MFALLKTILVTALCAGTALALSACGEKPQDKTGVRSDQPAQAGTGVAAFTEPGWKAGDKTSWEQQLKTRGQGQNDYAKAQ